VNRRDDSDDWFELDEPGGSRVPGAAGEEGDEDWLRDAPLPPRSWLEIVDRRVVVIAAVGVTFLIGVLAAAGVFSSSPATSVPPVTTPLITTTSTIQTTTTAPAQAVSAPTTNLKPGDTGTQVKVLQRALAHLGFSAGKVDGQYGTATEAAVTQFQTTKGLTADGIVGPATLAALKAALQP
jgi:Putative peptidoglycan binding domain